MAPEYGATCGFFPVDGETIRYLTMSGRAEDRIALVEAYSQGAGHVARRRLGRSRLHRHAGARPRRRSCRRWPVRSVRKAASRWKTSPPASPRRWRPNTRRPSTSARRYAVEGADYDLGHGDVVIAAITSCTNTSNPSGADRRRPARPQRQPARPQAEALGQDLARARQPGRRRISRQVRACRRSSTSSASTSSASAAPPASAIPARCRRRSPRPSTTRA